MLTTKALLGQQDDLVCEFRFRGNGAEQLANSGVRRRPASFRRSSTEKTPTSTDGLVDGAMAFSGAGDAVDLGQLFEFRRTLPFTLQAWLKHDGVGGPLVSKIDDATGSRGVDVSIDDGRVSVRLIDAWPDAAIRASTTARYPSDRWLHLSITYDASSTAEGIHIYINGEAQDLIVDVRSDPLRRIRNRAPLVVGGNSVADTSFRGVIDEVQFYKWALSTEDLAEAPRRMLRDVLKQEAVTEQQSNFAYEFFRDYVHPETATLRREIESLQRSKEQFAIPRLRVMSDAADRRATHVLLRGDFRSPGEQVEPNTPSMLPSLPRRQQGEYSRLDLAEWLVSDEQELTPRVTANRLWAQLFGRGIVGTLDDFGIQGDVPTHPELLNYLAGELVNSNWDIKSLIRKMVTSATYRQSSASPEKAWKADPANRLLARGPRKRLSAEALRDNALYISGLLSDQVGGPSVRPYQPAGLWRDMSKGDEKTNAYRQGHGKDLYRRGIYTFWKRSIHYPAFAVFDAPSREVCTSSRPTTNTPAQALAILNDPTFVEAARVFAVNIMNQGEGFEQCIQFAYRRALGRHGERREVAVLRNTYEQLKDEFREKPESAKSLIRVGETTTDSAMDEIDLAAWTTISQMILSLDETITQE